MAVVRLGVEEIARHFHQLEDPRSAVNRVYPLADVLTIAVMAVLAGANGPTAIAQWAECKRELLARVMSLPDGPPGKDVFRRVLCLLKPAAFQAAFSAWLADMRRLAAAAIAPAAAAQPLVAIDGKTLRRSHDRRHGLGPLHSVSAWAGELGLTLGQVACGEKSNEIAAIPELLRLVDIRGAIVTIDAMGTQKAIAAQIVEAGADYVLALKPNHEKLHAAAVEHIGQCLEGGAEPGPSAASEAQVLECPEETGHGRTVTRCYVQMPAPPSLPGREQWKGIKSIGVAFSETKRDGKATLEARYYLSSLEVDVAQFARAVRGHWSIENSCHWSLDVTFREDELRHRDERLRVNFAWLNRFALSLLKQAPGRQTVAGKRRKCAWSEDYLLQVLVGATI